MVTRVQIIHEPEPGGIEIEVVCYCLRLVYDLNGLDLR